MYKSIKNMFRYDKYNNKKMLWYEYGKLYGTVYYLFVETQEMDILEYDKIGNFLVKLKVRFNIREKRDNIKYSNTLKDIRYSNGLTQHELSELSGVNLRMIQHYEQGVKDINKAEAMTVYKLAEALDCNVSDLLEFKD